LSSVVTVGVFDGLHLGHRAILDHALAAAARLDAPSVVVSFDPHPDVVLTRSFQAGLPLTPIPEKRERLKRMGLDRLEVIPFTRELASLDPETFVKRHLIEPFDMGLLVVGEDFALGKGRAGNVSRLADIGRVSGFEVESVPLLVLDGEVVSSTRIRELLARGDAMGAARRLGRPYDLTGVVVPGEAVGRSLGYPTANLRLHEEKLLPADGVYAAWARIDHAQERRPAALSIGVRPTFGGEARALEAFLLDWSGDLRGHDVTVELIDWIRAQETFESGAALARAIGVDVEQVRERLSREARVTPASRSGTAG
jgi:riboflavin kinase / FMN adenylyltransferase